MEKYNTITFLNLSAFSKYLFLLFLFPVYKRTESLINCKKLEAYWNVILSANYALLRFQSSQNRCLWSIWCFFCGLMPVAVSKAFLRYRNILVVFSVSLLDKFSTQYIFALSLVFWKQYILLILPRKICIFLCKNVQTCANNINICINNSQCNAKMKKYAIFKLICHFGRDKYFYMMPNHIQSHENLLSTNIYCLVMDTLIKARVSLPLKKFQQDNNIFIKCWEKEFSKNGQWSTVNSLVIDWYFSWKIEKFDVFKTFELFYNP